MKTSLRKAVVIIVAGCLSSQVAAQSTEDKRRSFVEPENRASKFQHPADLFPSRTAQPSDNPLPLPDAVLPDGFEIRYEFDGKEYGVDEFNERTKSNALLVLKDGKIVHEIYRNGSGPETRFISFSTGKSFTSTLVGLAVEAGYIESVDEPLTNYLPALIGSAYDGVSIKDALQMASGVEWDESGYDFGNLSNPFAKNYEYSLIQQRYRFVEGANELPRVHEPGSHFNYNTLETCLLGWLVETATARRMTAWMEERLWQPAGMEFSAHWLLDGPEDIGRELAGGLLAAALRDYGRYGLLMSNMGKVRGEQLISSEWVKAATTADRAAVQHGSLYEGYPLGYGYQWWLFPNGRYEGQGVYGQFVFVAPEEDVVIIKLSHWPDAWVDEMEMETYTFFEATIEALRGL